MHFFYYFYFILLKLWLLQYFNYLQMSLYSLYKFNHLLLFLNHLKFSISFLLNLYRFYEKSKHRLMIKCIFIYFIILFIKLINKVNFIGYFLCLPPFYSIKKNQFLLGLLF